MAKILIVVDQRNMRTTLAMMLRGAGYEVDEAATRIREEVDSEANIIVGATFDESLDGMIRVSVVATGIDQVAMQQRLPAVEPRMTEVAQRIQAIKALNGAGRERWRRLGLGVGRPATGLRACVDVPRSALEPCCKNGFERPPRTSAPASLG